MDQLTGSGRSVKSFLAQMSDRLQWEIHRGTRAFQRRFGLPGLVVLAAILISAAALLLEWHQTQTIATVQAKWTDRSQVPQQVHDTSGNDARKRLTEFEAYLPIHDNIPTVVRSLLDLAAHEHLEIRRGEYRPQIDQQGRFMRYRMTLPVNGDAESILRFVHAALRAQSSLALESVQFKREKGESPVIEARIQWVVFTRLPESGASDHVFATPGGEQ